MVPAQLVRALLMSVVLYLLLDALGELAYPVRALVFGGLMLVYADVASPRRPLCEHHRGLVYLRERFVTTRAFWLIQSEKVIYSLLVGLVAAWLLF
jgi:hypothetical protein